MKKCELLKTRLAFLKWVKIKKNQYAVGEEVISKVSMNGL